MKPVKAKGLYSPDDVEIELRMDGGVNFYPHSNKGQIAIDKMTELEKMEFAVAITAKRQRGLGDNESIQGVKLSQLLAEINERMAHAFFKFSENDRSAPNSNSAGYEEGYANALGELLEFIGK